MNFAPIARIAIRYGVGLIIGADAAATMLADPDVVSTTATVIAAAAGLVTETLYALARRRGWAT